MPDAQIHPTGTEPTPADYLVPDSAELLLKGVYAEFDGTNAAGSYLPLVRIISDAGSTVIEAVSDTTIAAGASADASWFPRVGAAASASPTGAVSWVHLTDLNIPVLSRSSPHTHYDFTAATVYTNDSSTFSVVPGNGLRITGGGYFVATVACNFAGQLAAASAELNWNLGPEDVGLFDQDTFMKPDFAGGLALPQASQGFALTSSGSTADLTLLQTCGITAAVNMEASVVRLTTDTGNF